MREVLLSDLIDLVIGGRHEEDVVVVGMELHLVAHLAITKGGSRLTCLDIPQTRERSQRRERAERETETERERREG